MFWRDETLVKWKIMWFYLFAMMTFHVYQDIVLKQNREIEKIEKHRKTLEMISNSIFEIIPILNWISMTSNINRVCSAFNRITSSRKHIGNEWISWPALQHVNNILYGPYTSDSELKTLKNNVLQIQMLEIQLILFISYTFMQ